MAAVDQFCIHLCPRVKGAAAVEAEAVRILAIKARIAVQTARRVHVPDLDISVAEEVHCWRRAARDAADHTSILPHLAMRQDLLGSHGAVAVAVAVACHCVCASLMLYLGKRAKEFSGDAVQFFSARKKSFSVFFLVSWRARRWVQRVSLRTRRICSSTMACAYLSMLARCSSSSSLIITRHCSRKKNLRS